MHSRAFTRRALLTTATLLAALLASSSLALAGSKGTTLLKRAAVKRAAAAAVVTDIYLRAEAFNQTLPDGRVVRMWGFARDSAFGALDGAISSPGPLLTIPYGNPNIVVHLDNNLPEAISLVIPGIIEAGGMVPARNGDGRMRSFTHETPPGNAAPVDYAFTLRPGTFIYQSGSHQQIQVQMGLYGGLTFDAAFKTPYVGAPTYDAEAILFFSEIDPDLHDAVAHGDYGPGKLVTSAIDYRARYFLINGEPFRADGGFDPNIAAGAVGQRVLLRFFNAGLRTAVPLTQGLYMSVIAEDANLYAYPRTKYALPLPAMKTFDAFIAPAAAGSYPVYDRRLALTNNLTAGGGYLRYLVVNP